MTTTCPKCQYVRQSSDTAPDYECPACGVIYHKFMQRQNQLINQPGGDKQPSKGLASAGWSRDARLSVLFLIPFCLYISLICMRESYYGFQVGKWPSTTGVVLSAEISSWGRPPYPSVINYQYIVNDHIYQNDRIGFGALVREGKNADAQTSINLYHSGKQVAVYYNRHNPENSALEREVNHARDLLLLFVSLMGAAIATYYRFFKKA